MADVGAIKEQAEFYFGDSNLPRDNFLKGLVAADPERFVPVEKILSFKRMETLGANAENLKEALKESETLEFSEDGTKLRRKEAFDEAALEALDARSIYAKRFESNMDLDALKEFWNKEGSVRSIRMRRIPSTKDFKGTVFVEFSSPEEAAQVLAKDIEYKGEKLHMQTKKAFLAEKHEELVAKKSKKQAEAAAAPAEAKDPEFKPGFVVAFKGAGEGTDREAIKAVLEPLVKVAFVDYSRDQEAGTVRMEDSQEASVVAEAVEKLNAEAEEKKIADRVLTWSLVSGDEEMEYYRTVAAARLARRAGNKRSGGHRGGRGAKRQRN